MKPDVISDNIEKYPNIYDVILGWLKSIYVEKIIGYVKLFLLTLIIFIIFRDHVVVAASSIGLMVSWAIVIKVIDIKYKLELRRLDKKDGDFDRYLNMISTNAKRYKVLPDEENFIMMGAGDVVGDYLREVDDSIGSGIMMDSPYMVVTDEYIVSRSASSLKINPVAISKSMIEDISFYNTGMFAERLFAVYEFMNIHIIQISDKQKVKTIKRVVAKRGMFGRKKTKTITDNPFAGLKIVSDAKPSSTPKIEME